MTYTVSKHLIVDPTMAEENRPSPEEAVRLGSKQIFIQHIEGSALYKIKLEEGGILPPEWRGSFTSIDAAKDTVIERFERLAFNERTGQNKPHRKKAEKKAEMEARKQRAADRAERMKEKKEKAEVIRKRYLDKKQAEEAAEEATINETETKEAPTEE